MSTKTFNYSISLGNLEFNIQFTGTSTPEGFKISTKDELKYPNIPFFTVDPNGVASFHLAQEITDDCSFDDLIKAVLEIIPTLSPKDRTAFTKIILEHPIKDTNFVIDITHTPLTDDDRSNISFLLSKLLFFNTMNELLSSCITTKRFDKAKFARIEKQLGFFFKSKASQENIDISFFSATLFNITNFVISPLNGPNANWDHVLANILNTRSELEENISSIQKAIYAIRPETRQEEEEKRLSQGR